MWLQLNKVNYTALVSLILISTTVQERVTIVECQMSNSLAISWQEQVTKDVCFVLIGQTYERELHSACLLKQYFTCRYVIRTYYLVSESISLCHYHLMVRFWRISCGSTISQSFHATCDRTIKNLLAVDMSALGSYTIEVVVQNEK